MMTEGNMKPVVCFIKKSKNLIKDRQILVKYSTDRCRCDKSIHHIKIYPKYAFYTHQKCRKSKKKLSVTPV